MCGRFTLTIDPYHLQEAFPWAVIPDDLPPRYNIAPSQPVAVIPNTGDNAVSLYKWGLNPILVERSSHWRSDDQCPV